MNKSDCSVDWNCPECNASGSKEFGATGSARSFLQSIIWAHEEKSPACSGLNVSIQLPYDIPSASEIRKWREQQWAKRKQLRAKGLAAREKALAEHSAAKQKKAGVANG